MNGAATAASSLKEGLEETLTLHRLGFPEPLRKSLQSTNLIETALSVAADVTGRVNRWRGGDMRLRWSAAGLLQAEKNFRRILRLHDDAKPADRAGPRRRCGNHQSLTNVKKKTETAQVQLRVGHPRLTAANPFVGI